MVLSELGVRVYNHAQYSAVECTILCPNVYTCNINTVYKCVYLQYKILCSNVYTCNINTVYKCVYLQYKILCSNVYTCNINTVSKCVYLQYKISYYMFARIRYSGMHIIAKHSCQAFLPCIVCYLSLYENMTHICDCNTHECLKV